MHNTIKRVIILLTPSVFVPCVIYFVITCLKPGKKRSVVVNKLTACVKFSHLLLEYMWSIIIFFFFARR